MAEDQCPFSKAEVLSATHSALRLGRRLHDRSHGCRRCWTCTASARHMRGSDIAKDQTRLWGVCATVAMLSSWAWQLSHRHVFDSVAQWAVFVLEGGRTWAVTDARRAGSGGLSSMVEWLKVVQRGRREEACTSSRAVLEMSAEFPEARGAFDGDHCDLAMARQAGDWS